ncbi:MULTISPECIES: AlpA family transcriptional regulator [Enterobacteriaceae]|uniref:helix-turn-helix transcriptional regulator n=1 Tax=Enterobacteriaceae TaxID=543 RepID=UPI0022E6435D|nr:MULTISPECIES: AlpA family transcriptional regulator [Enterobacteriaceae]
MTDIEIIPEQEAMRMLKVSSRATIWKYTKNHNFPKPIKTHPKQYLKSAVENWILSGGINQQSS